jgi:multidrug transporter EmrE-like cation transporter
MNYALILTFGGGLLLTGGDLFMKEWIAKSDWRWFGVGLAFYFAGSVTVAFSFRYENIAIASLMLVVFNVVTLLLISWLVFHENLSPARLAAMAVALLAVAVLEVAK